MISYSAYLLHRVLLAVYWVLFGGHGGDHPEHGRVSAAGAVRCGARAEPDDAARLAFGLLFAGLFSPLVLAGRGENFWMVAAVWLPIAAILAAVARVYVTQKHAPDAMADISRASSPHS